MWFQRLYYSTHYENWIDKKKKRFEKNDFIHLKEEAIMTITHIFTLFFNYFRSYFLPQKMIMLIFLNLSSFSLKVRVRRTEIWAAVHSA